MTTATIHYSDIEDVTVRGVAIYLKAENTLCVVKEYDEEMDARDYDLINISGFSNLTIKEDY